MAKSYTQVSLYERCPFAYHCRYIERIPEPESVPLQRGKLVHDKIENYIKGKRKTLTDVHKKSKRLIDQMKEMNGGAEEFWHFNEQWEWQDDWSWLVVKVDSYGIPEEGTLRLVDWKTGKHYPNHKEQLHMYATAGFSTYDCNTVECIASYVDTGAAVVYRWKEFDYEQMKETWNLRIARLEVEKDWKMHPGHHCKWCSYGKSKGGPCSYG